MYGSVVIVMDEGCDGGEIRAGRDDQAPLFTALLTLPESRQCRTGHHDPGTGFSRIAGAFENKKTDYMIERLMMSNLNSRWI